MRKIAANYIFPVSQPPIKEGVITIAADGAILAIEKEALATEGANIEYYNGILIPGFVNTHCHLDLSHLHKKLPQKQGLGSYLKELRHEWLNNEEDHELVRLAEKEMWDNGIVAVGDICNETALLEFKAASKIKYHNFIEVMGLEEFMAEDIFTEALFFLYKIRDAYGLNGSIVPHAPYTVSSPLFELIEDYCSKNNMVFSIHNQESDAENELLMQKTGSLYESLNALGMVGGYNRRLIEQNSLNTLYDFYPKNCNTLFIHNTFTTHEDIEAAERELSKPYWVFCPNSNLYVENCLPDVYQFVERNCSIALGTDSLASNHQLSILEEIRTIQSFYPELPLEALVRWGTLNGAKALNMDEEYGSIDVGKHPGINLITHIDFEAMKLTSESRVQKLL